MRVGDVVAWIPTRGVYDRQKVKFVGIVTGEPVEHTSTGQTRVPVIWSESTMPAMTDIRDVKMIEAANESR